MDKNKIRDLIVGALSGVLSDDVWLMFGIAKVPKHGLITNLFRRQWKIDFESKLLNEMLAIQIALQIQCGFASSDDLDLIVSELLDFEGIYRALCFDSKESAKNWLMETAKIYLAENVNIWSGLLIKRLNLEEIPDKKYNALVVIGCAKYTLAAEAVLSYNLQNK